MATYTCITCRVAFLDAEIQRSHYKTDWHRYNLKRKVAELPPVTAENFQERVMAQRAQAEKEDVVQSGYCSLCQKKFGTLKAYENHLNSKKHKEVDAKQRRCIEDEVRRRNEKNEEKGLEVIENDTKVIQKDLKNLALKDAMAAGGDGPGSSSASLATKSKEKSGKAELFGDDDDDDSDWESVSSFEGEALGLEECLFCSQISNTLEDNIKHMTTAHSFFIPDVEYLVDLDGLIGYLGEKVGVGNVCLWCNEKGRSFHTVKSVQQHMIDKGHCKILFDMDNALEYADFYDYRSSYPDYKPGEEEADVDEEEEVKPELLAEENFQLVLPSGASIGHRSLMRYYRQNVPLQERKKSSSISKVMAHYKALGWTGAVGSAAVQKAKDLGYMQRMKHRHHMKLGVKANSFQRHFRNQNEYYI